MAFLTNSEYYEMILCVGAAEGSLRAARELYRERFVDGRPEADRRRLPSQECFRKMVTRLQHTGSFRGSRPEGRPGAHDPALQEAILDHFEDNPRTSTRRAAAVLGVNHMEVWRVLCDDGQHPYHFRRTQELTPADFAPRVLFSQWYRNQVQASPDFGSTVLWTDEASFTRAGISNVHNEHVWNHENPHAASESNFQHQWRVNVWGGIVGDFVIGPVFLPPRLNGENYLRFLSGEMEDALMEMPVQSYVNLVMRGRMTFQHDGAPAHFALAVREYLNERFPQWIGRSGPVAWPARSPDLTPLDFFLWGFVKNAVYAVDCPTRDEMVGRIQAAFRMVTPEMLRNVRSSMYRRTDLAIQLEGRHIEPRL